MNNICQLNKRKPKFIAYVNLLDALAEAGLVLRDSKNRNNLLVYRENSETKETGWFSENIFELAQELFDSEENKNNLFSVLKEIGKKPVFSEAGDFVELLQENNKET